MPVTLEHPHEQLVVMTITAPWKVDELIAVYPQMEKYYSAAEKPMYGITNIEKIGTIPPGALRARVSPMVAHKNCAHVYVVGAKGVARSLAEAVFTLTHFEKIDFYDTEAEAMAHFMSSISSHV